MVYKKVIDRGFKAVKHPSRLKKIMSGGKAVRYHTPALHPIASRQHAAAPLKEPRSSFRKKKKYGFCG